jgi:hypothetical protein
MEPKLKPASEPPGHEPEGNEPLSGHARRKGSTITLTRLFEKTSKVGRRVLSGRLGFAKILVFETDEISGGNRIWEIVAVPGVPIERAPQTILSPIKKAAVS